MNMKRSLMVKTDLDDQIEKLVRKTDKRTLVIWACDCAKRVLPYFEKQYPDDPRPRQAIEAGRTWVKDGVFKMTVIRKASLDAHAAARNVINDDVARSAARACGQAVAATHVPTHSIAAAIYAATVIRDSVDPKRFHAAVMKERRWQLQRLQKLGSKSLWSVYMVRCKDGSLYTGITTDIAKRIAAHNGGKGAAYTRSRRPVELVWKRKMATGTAARKLEAKLKQLSKAEKERMLDKVNGS